jgi:hypothetical protein
MIAAALPDELFEKGVPAPYRNATASVTESVAWEEAVADTPETKYVKNGGFFLSRFPGPGLEVLRARRLRSDGVGTL